MTDTSCSTPTAEHLTASVPPPAVLSALYRTGDRVRAHWLHLNHRYLADLGAMATLLTLALAVLLLPRG
jgi:hypothetical protein